MKMPTIGDTVIYTQPEHEDPFEGRRDHLATVTGFGSTRWDNALTVEVAFIAAARQLDRVPDEAEEDYAKRVTEDQVARSFWLPKVDVTPTGDDKGNGTWCATSDGAADLIAAGADIANLTADATG